MHVWALGLSCGAAAASEKKGLLVGLAKVGHPNFGQSRSIKVGQSLNFFGQSRFGQSGSQPSLQAGQTADWEDSWTKSVTHCKCMGREQHCKTQRERGPEEAKCPSLTKQEGAGGRGTLSEKEARSSDMSSEKPSGSMRLISTGSEEADC